MKRLRIWLSNFTLLQQFLSVGFLTVAVLAFFILSFLNNSINLFVNSQMHTYLHNEQEAFLQVKNNYGEYSNANVEHFVYSKSTSRYISQIPSEYKNIVGHISPIVLDKIVDGKLEIDDEYVVYTIRQIDDDYILVSLVRNTFRNEFRDALISSVVSVILYVVIGLIMLIMIWVVSLITPLNQITSYINKIKSGENATLNISRHDEIGEVAEALVLMNEEVSRQQHIRDEMIQNISHDLKTPIATIKSYSESIKDGVYPYDTLEKSVDVITEHANRLEKKVYSLITYNKLGYLNDTAPQGLNLKMAPIIQKAILSCEVLRNDIQIETDIDENVCFHGDEEPWRVVVENLLDNALRYASSIIKINLRDNLLEVYNDGDQIEKDRLDKMFKPYEKGTKGKFGLGLSIVKKVTETYGYNVLGENMDDGVIFRIYPTVKMKKPAKKKIGKKGIIDS